MQILQGCPFLKNLDKDVSRGQAANAGIVAWNNRRSEDRFVLGKRFLGDERSRQIQVAARPSLLSAERAET